MPSFESSLQNFDKFTRRCTHQSRTASKLIFAPAMSFSALAVDVLHPSICFSHIKNGHEGDAFTLHDESQILSFIGKKWI